MATTIPNVSVAINDPSKDIFMRRLLAILTCPQIPVVPDLIFKNDKMCCNGKCYYFPLTLAHLFENNKRPFETTVKPCTFKRNMNTILKREFGEDVTIRTIQSLYKNSSPVVHRLSDLPGDILDIIVRKSISSCENTEEKYYTLRSLSHADKRMHEIVKPYHAQGMREVFRSIKDGMGKYDAERIQRENTPPERVFELLAIKRRLREGSVTGKKNARIDRGILRRYFVRLYGCMVTVPEEHEETFYAKLEAKYMKDTRCG